MFGDTALQTLENFNDATDFDTEIDTTASIALQFQDLFGQDVLYEDISGSNSPFYDELTFAPDQAPVNTVEPANMMNQSYVGLETPVQKRQRHSSSSSSSSSSSFCSSSSSEEDDGDSFSALNSYRSHDIQVPTPAQRQQMENLILDKITNQLDPEKLPGILTIISTSDHEEDEEVEVDLARLNIDQLSRILSYVDACLLEKNGGPKVRPFDYAVKKTKSTKKSRRRRRHQSIVDQGHVVDGSSYASSLAPVSSIMESDDDDSYIKKRKRTKKSKKENKNNNNNNNNNKQKNRQKEKTAAKKSKKKSVIHKRRLLEEMLHPQNIETDDEEDEAVSEGGNGIIIFGDEKMDFAVTRNETIAHQRRESIVIQPSVQDIPYKINDQKDEEEEDDELIDIML